MGNLFLHSSKIYIHNWVCSGFYNTQKLYFFEYSYSNQINFIKCSCATVSGAKCKSN